METPVYATLDDVCDFLIGHNFVLPITSFGINREFVENEDGSVTTMPSIKPRFLFRGQTKAYETLRPNIYRGYSPSSSWNTWLTLKTGNAVLNMPHPFYTADLERDFYFSSIKAVELTLEMHRRFPENTKSVNGHALCQHYGLKTHFLDFSEDIWVSAFFASHIFRNDQIIPCKEGIGVMYVLDTRYLADKLFFEIGIQPLPRPFEQKGWLLDIQPDFNLLGFSGLHKFYFQHSEKISQSLGERFHGGADLLPDDEVTQFLEGHTHERFVTQAGLDRYLDQRPASNSDMLRNRIITLFSGQIVIR